jgi:signal transduction histidine kinase
MSFGRRQNLNPVRLEMPVFLAAKVALLQNAAGDAQLELAVAPGIPALLADRSGLVTALINLVANARHAIEVRRGSEGAANGPAGTGFSSTIGHIRIAATAVEVVGADEQWPLLPPGTYVAVSVQDDGCGMPAGVLAQAVEPFFTTRLPGEGSGLGLSMVQGFARQTGGDLRLVSQAGEGTTVTLLLPAINSILPPCSN